MTTDNHGLDQAQAKAYSIASMVAALMCDYDRLQELRDERADLASAAEDPESEDETAQAIAALAQWDDENAEELNTLEHEAGDCTDEQDARSRIHEDALSVEVRSGWDFVGGDLSAAEFRIVLCTGGPHVEIVGELDNGQPCRAWLQYQDWGTPMTQFFKVEQSTLLAYCQEFYFES
jgi:DNA-binding ferritin-like protein